MIGQLNLLTNINKLIDSNFPRFTVITGPKGQGKKTVANHIAKKLGYHIIETGIKIDEIRTIIELAYKQTEPIIYLIADADKMSLGAKNSLLKIIEEPPNNAYFILTLKTIENTLPTIKSRCIELKMDSYSEGDLNRFIGQLDKEPTDIEKCIIYDICENKYEIDLLIRYGVKDFYNYVSKVVDNIYQVQSANAFKILEKINLKTDEDKYDAELFLRTYKIISMNRLLLLIDEEDRHEEYKCYAESINVTSQTINQLNINGINKQSLLDMWILDIRKVWRENLDGII